MPLHRYLFRPIKHGAFWFLATMQWRNHPSPLCCGPDWSRVKKKGFFFFSFVACITWLGSEHWLMWILFWLQTEGEKNSTSSFWLKMNIIFCLRTQKHSTKPERLASICLFSLFRRSGLYDTLVHRQGVWLTYAFQSRRCLGCTAQETFQYCFLPSGCSLLSEALRHCAEQEREEGGARRRRETKTNRDR